jgi:CheY-like chemotaxis protein
VRRILIVDDERTITSTLAAILQDEGYQTATAYSGEEAVQVASFFEPHFIISDVMMGGINGIEAAIQILGALPVCRVLFISGLADYRELLENARARGFHFEVLEKPLDPPKLLARISQVLSLPAHTA